MLEQGAEDLKSQASAINALNVFPVPDGDTGTNMSLTMESGIKQLKNGQPKTIGQAGRLFAKGLLMGARGNSGVILSQLFRGFSRAVDNHTDLDAETFARAFQSGVEVAYNAVMKPVEGTILTVAKEAAKAAQKKARQGRSVDDVMEATLRAAEEALQHTPKLLPLLKEAGVVDSGGQGLVSIYKGFLFALKNAGGTMMAPPEKTEETPVIHPHQNAQTVMKTEDITYGYCTEIMVRFHPDQRHQFDETAFRKQLSKKGDSLLVVSDEDLLKVHIHTEKPGDILTLGQSYGELIKIKIDNMREQHAEIVHDAPFSQDGEKQHVGDHLPVDAVDASKRVTENDVGIVTVATGKGVETLFKSIGATVVLEGGQTMNPSTEDLVKAIRQTQANHVLVLPNNGNIVMAAKQAAEVAAVQVKVIATKSVAQGLAALMSFRPDQGIEQNAKAMEEALGHVKSGQVTRAVRDTTVNNVNIKTGDYIGLYGDKIITAKPERLQAAKALLTQMIQSDDELVTIIYGENVEKNEADDLARIIEARYDDLEVEVHDGQQSVYDYLIAVE
ncbi:DAK2 domain-containing protein [Camelliibacillus cellulosilyticus]|uniref:DAK2 domain-containing protein n=1 Tax=Camelliibacillus cellulosilyticus TaxID=2174486 RepID=A0ABV9GID4_9BACL